MPNRVGAPDSVLFFHLEMLFGPLKKSLRRAVTRDSLWDEVTCPKACGGPMQLRLSTRTIDAVLIIDAGGHIVFGEESASLRDTVKKLIPDNKNIVLNLGGVNYIDSGGLGTLVALYTTAHNAGGSIKLANLTQRVGDLLQVTKLLTVFQVYDSEEKAIASFGKGAAA